MNILGKKTLLRAMEAEDMELLRDMLNDPAIENAVGGWGFPVSRAQQQRWFETAVNDAHTKRFIIETADTDTPTAIGMIYLTDIDWKNRSVATGIKLASSAPRRNGYATDAVMALFDYVFSELQMHRISLKILSHNAASSRLYERCGAKREGVLREAVFKSGQYWDQYTYGVLKADFAAAKQALYG